MKLTVRKALRLVGHLQKIKSLVNVVLVKNYTMKSKIILIAGLVLLSKIIIAQTTIKASFTNEEGNPIEMGNIILLSAQDSSLINGSYFMDGLANLEIATEGIIKITAVGFNDLFVPVTTLKKEVNLGQLKMQTNQLEEFEVVEQVPLFEERNGSTVVNVEKTMLGSSSNTKEVLSKSPGVIVTDQAINVVGKGEAIIFLNQRKISLERLNSIPVSQIKNIEVITNPGAEYDAQGAAVINIKLKENHYEGHQVNLLQHFTKGMGFLTYTVLGYNYQKNKFSLTTDFNINVGGTGVITTSNNQTSAIPVPYNSNVDYKEDIYLTNVSNALIGTSYSFNDNNKLSFEYNGGYWVYDIDATSTYTINYDTNAVKVIDAQTDARSTFKSHSGSINYELTLDSLGSNLFVGGQMSNYLRNINDKTNEDVAYTNEPITNYFTKNDGTVIVKDVAGQLDYKKVFKNKTTMSAGAKYSQVSTFNNMRLNSDAIGVITNDFKYLETIGAGYLKLNKSIKKKNIELGLRIEASNPYGESITQDSTIIDNNYSNVFPSFSMSYPIKSLKVRHSYSARINRPDYESMNPFYIYLNNNSSFQGNPNLKPEYAHSIETSMFYTKEGKKLTKNLKVAGGYTFTQDPMRFIMQVDSANGSILLQMSNAKSSNKYYNTIGFSIGNKKWSSYSSLTTSYESLQGGDIKFYANNLLPEFYFYNGTEIKFKLFNVELNGEYISRSSDGLNVKSAQFAINPGVNKSFFKDKLFVQFLVNDIFHTAIDESESNLVNVNSSWRATQDTRYFRFLIKYSFGSLKFSKYNHKTVNQEGNNRVRKQ